jgi:hypothetical protein
MALPLECVNVLDLTNVMAGCLKDGDMVSVEQYVLGLNDPVDRLERGFRTRADSSLQ